MADLDRDAVAARAYALYVRGGRRPGRALEDWVEAERQLRAEASAAAGLDAARPTLVPGAPIPSLKPVPVTPPASALAVPAAHVEASKPAPAAAPRPAAAPAPKPPATPIAKPQPPSAKPQPPSAKPQAPSGPTGKHKDSKKRR